MTVIDFYGGQEPQQLALYTYADAARYLDLSASTVRAWVRGGSYTSGTEKASFAPVLSVASNGKSFRGLSFLDLTELFVLKALRRDHNVRLENIRRALHYAEETLDIKRLLLMDVMTYDRNVFVRRYGELINLSRGGQIALEAVLKQYLSRVDRDDRSTPITLYPIVEGFGDDKPVAINPRVSFGKPTISGTGTNTAVVARRYEAGETVDEIAHDYDIDPRLVEGAISYEYARAA